MAMFRRKNSSKFKRLSIVSVEPSKELLLDEFVQILRSIAVVHLQLSDVQPEILGRTGSRTDSNGRSSHSILSLLGCRDQIRSIISAFERRLMEVVPVRGRDFS